MKLHYAGKYSGNPDDLPYLEHEPGAVQFKEAKDAKALSKITTSLSIGIMLVLIILSWIIAGDVFFSYASIFIYLLTIIPHEILHASCFKGDVYLYQDLAHGMLFVTGPERMSKARFIFKCLFPSIVLGFVPYIIFIIDPKLQILGTLGALGVASAAGDFYNAYNAMTQMPKNAWAYQHKFETYWYIPAAAQSDQ